jgi:HSP20 family protein
MSMIPYLFAHRPTLHHPSLFDDQAMTDYHPFYNPFPTMSVAMPTALKMATDVSDTAEAYTIKAELPGVPKESVTVEVHRNVVTIEAVKEEQRKEDTETRRYSERSFGKIRRSFRLPETVVMDSAKCSYDHGVLTVAFSKTDKVIADGPKTLPIE